MFSLERWIGCLHNRDGFQGKLAEKIKAIIKETGYKKNTVASRLIWLLVTKLKIAGALSLKFLRLGVIGQSPQKGY